MTRTPLIAILALALAAPALAQQPAGDVDAALRAGRAALDAGKPRDAIVQLDRVVALAPKDWRGYYYRARARRAAGDAMAAIADFTRTIALDPSLPDAYCWRADARLAVRELDGALADLAKALELDPRHADSYAIRARARFIVGKRSDSLEDLTRAVELAPRNPEHLVDRGGVRLAAGQVKGAIADLTAALALTPPDRLRLRALSSRAQALVSAGQTEKALADLDGAIRLEQGSASLFRQRAKVRLLLGDTGGAVSDAERALTIDPKGPTDLLERAKVAHAKPKVVDWTALRNAAQAGLPGWRFVSAKPVKAAQIEAQARALPVDRREAAVAASGVRELRVVSFVGPNKGACHVLVAIAHDAPKATRFLAFDRKVLAAKAKAFGARAGYESSYLEPAAELDLSADGGADGFRSAVSLSIPARKLVYTSVAVLGRKGTVALEVSIVAPGARPTVDANALLRRVLGALGK